MPYFVRSLVFALLLSSWSIVASAACEPVNALPGMIGCWPQVTTMATTDSVDIWQPGPFPASANRIHLLDLLHKPGPIGDVTPNTGAFSRVSTTSHYSAIGASGLYTNWADYTSPPFNTGTGILTWAGTAANPGSVVPLGLSIQVGTTMDSSAAGGAVGALIQTYSYTGAKGGLTGLMATTSLVQVSGLQGGGYVGASFAASGNVTDGAGTSNDNFVGVKAVGQLINGATGMNAVYGGEFGIGGTTGTGAAVRNGVVIVVLDSNTLQGSTSDAGLQIISQTTATAGVGLKSAIDIGGANRTSLHFPVDPAGWLMKVSLGAGDGTPQIAGMLDWSQIGVCTDSQIKGLTFRVDCNGNVSGQLLVAGGFGGVVNAARLSGEATGSSPSLSAIGSDTNIGFTFQTQGHATFVFKSTGSNNLALLADAGTAMTPAVSYPVLENAPAGSGISLDVGGTVTGLNLGLNNANAVNIGHGGISTTVLGSMFYFTTTGTATQFVCATSGGQILLKATACTP